MPVYCEDCPSLSFVNCAVLKRHTESVHGDKFTCAHCKFETGRKDTLELHSRKHFSTKNFACDKCECKYFTANSLYTHKKLKHSAAAMKENEMMVTVKRQLEEAQEEIRFLKEML